MRFKQYLVKSFSDGRFIWVVLSLKGPWWSPRARIYFHDWISICFVHLLEGGFHEICYGESIKEDEGEKNTYMSIFRGWRMVNTWLPETGMHSQKKNRNHLLISHSYGAWPIYRCFIYKNWWLSIVLLNYHKRIIGSWKSGWACDLSTEVYQVTIYPKPILRP